MTNDTTTTETIATDAPKAKRGRPFLYNTQEERDAAAKASRERYTQKLREERDAAGVTVRLGRPPLSDEVKAERAAAAERVAQAKAEVKRLREEAEEANRAAVQVRKEEAERARQAAEQVKLDRIAERAERKAERERIAAERAQTPAVKAARVIASLSGINHTRLNKADQAILTEALDTLASIR